MIIISGAAGFIGSCLVSFLNQKGRNDLLIVDDFSYPSKAANLHNKQFNQQIERLTFFEKIKGKEQSIEAFIHLGARTDTSESSQAIFDQLNLNYSKHVWNFCSENNIPLVYASSAATYGNGALGFEDQHEICAKLQPLNPYGRSKNDFDIWALAQKKMPPFWAGLKFFNVYGPNEYHKGRMASVIFHCFQQIKKSGQMKLFRSHRPDFKNGEQSRDFIYVKDLLNIIDFLLEKQPENGLYNLGTAKARSFLDLAKNTFKAMNLNPNIDFIDTPEDIRESYQYFTEANMQKLLNAGYNKGFHSLEEGVQDYVQQYLLETIYY